ncbi:MAG: tRNA-splicing endonuclease subunit [Chaenotheca gracillima]|nr:MAG: tRNA-splicing endonuclease subunit [Chaenotheca gracillima]
MSAPGAGDGGKPPSERRQSLTKFMTKAKSVLRKDKSKRQSVSGLSAPPPAASTGASSSATPATPAASKPVAPAPTTTTAAAAAAPVSALAPGPSKKAVPPSRTNLQQERARAMFEKYGLTLEPHEWTSPTKDPSERVSKPIRVRVHRSCHRCQTTYGIDKVCANCSHKRCKKCPRYPLRQDAKDARDAGKVAGLTTAEAGKAKSKREVVAVPGGPGQERARRDKPSVRRTCHLCNSTYPKGDESCPGCAHLRCALCPRDPPRKSKYPAAHPDDEPGSLYLHKGKERTYKKVRMMVKYHCHTCDTVFGAHSKTCGKCSHERCGDCRRQPPKKAKPAPPDPEILKAIEQKMGKMSLLRSGGSGAVESGGESSTAV